MAAITDPRVAAAANPHSGHTMRDAAVEPLAKDFLPPSNAGVSGPTGNPHGPTVVAPGIHGIEGVRSIPSGPVSDNDDTQEAKELANLEDWQPQTEVVETP